MQVFRLRRMARAIANPQLLVGLAAAAKAFVAQFNSTHVVFKHCESLFSLAQHLIV